MRQRVRRGSRTVAATVGSALAASVVLGACSGGDDGPGADPGGGASASTPAAKPSVETRVSFGKITGALGRPVRDRLATDVQSVVDGWLDAAYVDGDYPRTDFADAWPGFTRGARAEARRDAELMSNAGIGADVEGVEPVGRALRIDVLAVKRRPVGVTAHVILKFDTAGASAERVKVAGRLYLTRTGQGWQVFGYDVKREAA